MSSRTIMKQQIMREKVMIEERPQKEVSSMTNETYTDDGFISPSNNDYLSSLISTSVTSNKHIDYCKSFLSNTKDIVYNFETVYPIDNRYNFSDFSHQSSNINNFTDSNSCNNQFHNLNNKIHEVDQVHDIYKYETSLSCPVTPDQSTSSYKQRRNSNSAVSGAMFLNYVEKQIQLKERSKKESHNRIERKRRDFINQQIVELGNLLPRQMMTEGESKKNKGNILKNSVVYIQHLQSEVKNTFNNIKEASLAYNLVENYRKQIQEIQQLKSFCSQNGSSLSDSQNTTEIYSQYLMMREQNQRNIQSTNHLSSSNNTLLSEIQSNGSPYKIETNSAYSSQCNNSSNSTYRKEEEDKDESIPHNEMLCPRQYIQKCSSSDNEYFFNSNNHSSGFERQRLESMEC